ncbi:MAG: hypothetical protein QOG62_1730 [Thermoleophilaceae bacterium]|nr:hypothetical protein [Thermoleophilaceae bacterium]
MESGTDVERDGGFLANLWRQGASFLASGDETLGGGGLLTTVPPTVDPERIVPRDGAKATTRWDSRRRRALALADAFALLAAYAVVNTILPSYVQLTWGRWLPLVIVCWILLNKLLGLYDRDANLIHKSTLNELPLIIESISLGVGVIFMGGPPLLDLTSTRFGIVVFWGIAVALTPMLRYGARGLVRLTVPTERCLIVGAGPISELLARKIESHPHYGAEVVAIIDVLGAPEEPADPAERSNLPHFTIESFREFEQIVRDQQADRVLIGFSRLPVEGLLEIIQTSKLLDLKITIVPRLFEMIGHSVEVDQVEGMTLLGVRGFTRTRSSLALKRLLDTVGAASGLIVLSPLLVAVALAIKFTSKGPVFFRQQRIGQDNQAFTLLKFRTMVDDADSMKAGLRHLNEADGIMFKIADDPRVTRVGKQLRRTSIDELPQLWNVLRGEMSLVGPRPLVPDEDGQVIGWHRARLELTPGLTGPWQVLGRTRIPFNEMVRLDYLYVAEWSLWNDIKLLLRTAPVVLLRRGA